MKYSRKIIFVILFFLLCLLILILNLYRIGPSTDDWIYGLPGDYELWRINSRTITLQKKEPDQTLRTEIVGPFVSKFASIPNYIFIQQVNVSEDISTPIDISSPVFFIISISNNILYGPLSESAFQTQIEMLGISAQWNWINTLNLTTN